MPIQQGCRIKIIYPEVFKITDKLTSMDGSGFFAPKGGQVQFELDIENNSFEVVACQKNYG